MQRENPKASPPTASHPLWKVKAVKSNADDYISPSVNHSPAGGRVTPPLQPDERGGDYVSS